MYVIIRYNSFVEVVYFSESIPEFGQKLRVEGRDKKKEHIYKGKEDEHREEAELRAIGKLGYAKPDDLIRSLAARGATKVEVIFSTVFKKRDEEEQARFLQTLNVEEFNPNPGEVQTGFLESFTHAVKAHIEHMEATLSDESL